MRSRPRMPFTVVNYARKFTGVNGCGCVRSYMLAFTNLHVPGAPCGRACRKVVRQWDFSHCVRKSTRVGACAGVFVCLWGVGAPYRGWCPLGRGRRRAPAAVPSPLVRSARFLSSSLALVCSACCAAPACSRLARLVRSLLRSLGLRPPAAYLTAPYGAAIARPFGALN